jgi:hypothetical protein
VAPLIGPTVFQSRGLFFDQINQSRYGELGFLRAA